MRFLCFLSIYMFLVIPLFSEGSATIYYSSSLNGNFDGCDCQDQPRAGLIKRAGFLRRVDDHNSVILDGGDFLDIFPDRLLHNNIAMAYGDLGYDLVLPGDQDWNEGVQWLLQSGLPLGGDNIYLVDDMGGGEPLSQPRIFERNGLTMGVISLVEKSVYRFISSHGQEALQVIDPLAVGKDLSYDLSGEVDVQILLYHGTLEEAEILGANCPDLDIIILAHEQQLIERLRETPVILSPGEGGDRLGILDIHVNRRGRVTLNNRFELFDYYESPDDPALREVMNDYLEEMALELQ